MIESKTVKIPTSWSPSTPQSDVELGIRYYLSEGNQQSSSGVLLLPFWGGCARTYDQVIGELASLKPDAIGLSISYVGTGGLPAPPDDRGEMHSIEPKAEQLFQLSKTQEGKDLAPAKKLVIVGHSMSAKVSYKLASKLAEENVDFEIAGIVLVGPAPVGQLILPPELADAQPRVYDTPESAKSAIENVMSNKKLDPAIVDQLSQDCSGMTIGAKEGWIKHGMKVDCTENLAIIKKKWPNLVVKVVMGEKDVVETVEKVTDQTVKPLQEAGFEVEPIVIEDVGHLIPLEAPQDVARVIASLL